ncbi:MAG: AMP-binding protein [Hyphomicrobiales bacterium]|nr:AMP-binding protein [Hyphomicrobiales bacterium]
MKRRTIYLDDRGVDREIVLANGRRAATGLASLGVGEGDCVALLLRNDFVFFEAQQAAAALGAYSIPINWHGAPDEILYVVNDARPKAMVAHADLLAAVRHLLPEGLAVLVAPTPPEIARAYHLSERQCAPAPREVAWGDWLSGFEEWTGAPKPTRATMIYTSGTTGHPKGVQRAPASPEQAAAYIEMIARVYGLAPGVRALVAGPLYHASPNAYGRQALPNADVLVMQSKFDAEAALRLIETHRITNAVMVPTMFIRLLKLPHDVRARYDVSSLQWVTHTGAPCPAPVKRELMNWWGPIVYETYGGTEVGTATLATPDDAMSYPGSVGAPTPGTRIAFYDETGNLLPTGEIGEIYMRVPAYADFTYLNDPEKRSRAERDGLISVGDIGYLKDGHLYLCDRRSDMVISAGANIYPAEIENVLVQCPGVQDCAVFGIPDDEVGESLVAAVEPAPDAEVAVDAIREFLAARIAKYKIPGLFEFYAALPRHDSGKIFKRKLREQFLSARGS